jgi:MULE transposase domain
MASSPPSPTPSEASSHFEGFGIDDDLFAVKDYGAQAEELATNGPNAPPPTDRTFSSLAHAETYCQEWARDHGYALVTRNGRNDPGPGKQPPYEKWMNCELGGKRRTNGKKVEPQFQRKEKTSKKMGCTFKLKLSRPIRKPDEPWIITVGNSAHTCDAAYRPSSLRTNRRLDRVAIASEIKDMQESNMTARAVYTYLKEEFPDAAITLKDVKNEFQKLQDQANRGYPIIQAMMRGLEEGPWVFDYCYDDSNRLERLVFCHKKTVELLHLFPNVIILDATYKTNRFNLPLINICTMTATGQTLLIGQAFVTYEEISDYEWLLKWYKKLCNDRQIPHPITFVTDKAGGMLGALPLVFPQANHLLCIWHINKDVKTYCLKFWRKESGQLRYDRQQAFAQEKWDSMGQL